MANRYFQKVVDQGLSKGKFTNILLLKSLKALGKEADIEQIINQPKLTINPIDRWIIATWTEDNDLVNELLNDELTKDLFQGRKFEIIQKIMNLP